MLSTIMFKIKQVEILMKINWCIPTVNIKHFLDHYLKILPISEESEKVIGTEYSRLGSPSEQTDFSPLNEKAILHKTNQLPSVLLKEINKEIADWISSIGNLSPLLYDYWYCNFSEMALAIMCVTVSFSFKWIAGKIIKHLKLIRY